MPSIFQTVLGEFDSLNNFEDIIDKSHEENNSFLHISLR